MIESRWNLTFFHDTSTILPLHPLEDSSTTSALLASEKGAKRVQCIATKASCNWKIFFDYDVDLPQLGPLGQPALVVLRRQVPRLYLLWERMIMTLALEQMLRKMWLLVRSELAKP
jgi:hypothetical protein